MSLVDDILTRAEVLDENTISEGIADGSDVASASSDWGAPSEAFVRSQQAVPKDVVTSRSGGPVSSSQTGSSGETRPNLLKGRPVWVEKVEEQQQLQPRQPSHKGRHHRGSLPTKSTNWVEQWGESAPSRDALPGDGQGLLMPSSPDQDANPTDSYLGQESTKPERQPEKLQPQNTSSRPMAGTRVNRISLGKIVWGIELLDPGAYSRWTRQDWIGSVLQLYR